MGRIFHSGLSPQEKLHRSHELLRWAEGLVARPKLHPDVRTRARRVVALARKSIKVRRVAMRAAIKPVK